MRKIEDVILKDGRNLKEVLELHKKWLEEGGSKRADLSYEDLSDVDFSDLNLRYAILRGANLEGANLRSANLRGTKLTNANLRGAKLTDANLIGANLIGVNLTNAYLVGANLTNVDLVDANLTRANLREANLTRANLREANLTDVNLIGTNLIRAILIDANLTGVKYDHTTSFFALQCQEEGSFIGYKKANDKIVKLLITKDAKRSSATTRRCRCSKAKVLSITSLDGKENFKKVNSDYDIDFVYEVGKVIEVKNYDDNRWNECSTGIHFFITRDEAVMY